MTIQETRLEAVKARIAYTLAPGVYRLEDHSLCVVDEATNKALIIQMPEPKSTKEEA